MDRRLEELIVDGLHILHVLYNHECDLEGDRVIKYTKVQTGGALQLIETVYQGVSVDIQLTGGLGNVQVVLEELVDRGQGFLVELIR